MTAISMITGGWCCRPAARACRRASERKERSRKPRARQAEKRRPLKQKIAQAEAEIERITGIIAKIDTALALPDLFTRDPKQAAQLCKARAGADKRATARRRRMAESQFATGAEAAG